MGSLELVEGDELNRIDNIQGLRGIAVLLVLFSHLFRIEEKYGGNSILPEFVLGGISGVDLFFVISGFIMVAVTTGKKRGSESALTFIYQRASRIYPLYWVYTTLVLMVFLINRSWVNGGMEVDLLSSYLLLPQDSAPLLNVGWTLVHEMYFYIVFFLVLFLPERFVGGYLLIWAIGILLLNLFFDFSSPFLKLVLNPLTYEFIGGGLLALFFRGAWGWMSSKILILTSFFLILLMLLGNEVFTEHYGEQPHGWWRLLVFGVPSLAIVFLLVKAGENGFRLPRWLISVGDASYSIYLSHVLVLSVLGRGWYTFATSGVGDNLIVLPVIVISSLIFGFISYHILEKPALRLSKKIFHRMKFDLKTA